MRAPLSASERTLYASINPARRSRRRSVFFSSGFGAGRSRHPLERHHPDRRHHRACRPSGPVRHRATFRRPCTTPCRRSKDSSSRITTPNPTQARRRLDRCGGRRGCCAACPGAASIRRNRRPAIDAIYAQYLDSRTGSLATRASRRRGRRHGASRRSLPADPRGDAVLRQHRVRPMAIRGADWAFSTWPISKPFTLNRVDQFRPQPPPPLQAASPYTRDYDE